MPVQRIDHGGAALKPVRLPNGFLRVDATITRAGIFEYRNPDGTVRRELRPPSEVFDAESLASFESVPVTDEHPPKMLDADDAADYSRGAAGEARRDADGVHVASRLLVTDRNLVAKLDDGKARQTSCGYTCDLDETPGVDPVFGRYDAIQRKIRGNHVAIVPRGRAGSARVRMDGAAVSLVRSDTDAAGDSGDDSPDTSQHRKAPAPMPMKTIRLDGVDFDPTSDAFAQAFAKQQAAIEAERKARADAEAAAKKEADGLQAKFDAMTEKVTKLEADAKEAPKRFAEAARARVELETNARKVLGGKAKFDGLSAKEIHLAVLKRAAPAAKLDGKSDEYLAMRFDMAIEAADGDAGTDAVKPTETERADDVDVTDEAERADSADAYQKMVAEQRDGWKKTLADAQKS